MAASKKTRGLGKGLDALFGDAEVTLQSRTEKNSKNEDEETEEVSP